MPGRGQEDLPGPSDGSDHDAKAIGNHEEEGDRDAAIAEQWKPYDRPRIRHLTGIRIHQLTLPESLAFARKLTNNDDQLGADFPSPFSSSSVGESSSLRGSGSPSTSFQFSHGQTSEHSRHRSSSASTARPSYFLDRGQERGSDGAVEPISPTVSSHHTLPRTRVARARAPTLAGEALEHGATSGSALLRRDTASTQQPEQVRERRPLRCFVVLKLPEKANEVLSVNGSDKEERRRTKSDERDLKKPIKGNARPPISRSSSSTPSTPAALPLPSTPTRSRSTRPALSSSSSSSSLPTSEHRTRTVSLNSPIRKPGSEPSPLSIDVPRRSSISTGSPILSRTSSRISQDDSKFVRSPPRSLNGLLNKKSRPSLSISHQIANGHLSPTQPSHGRSETPPSTTLTNDQEDKEPEKPSIKEIANPTVPFFISRMEGPTTHPRFLGLEEGDFAFWLTDAEKASDTFELEIWVENPSSHSEWIKVSDVGGTVRLCDLRRGLSSSVNGMEFTLSHNSKEVYHLPLSGDEDAEDGPKVRKGILERSLRETRMKRGAGVGGIHQLVNLQAVVADTQWGIKQVQCTADALLIQDVDGKRLRREVEERKGKVGCLQEKIAEVEKATREAQARITLQERDIETRRRNLTEAEEADELRHGMARDLEEEIRNIDTERLSLVPAIHELRAHHAQALDTLFPIQPLEPSQLLYTILNVPLPIPVGTKDPAPPLSLPEHKVDERSTAAALGYVAMTVQILGHLGGITGGLPYIITCAGSKSAVRDGTGVMHGPRSFPLYAKGVERYRYEYAVFLLNKNIEMLMQETNIRLLDLRHTLPNLKNLLLTLSYPSLPPPPTNFSQHQHSRTGHSHRSGAGSASALGLNAGAGVGGYRSGTPTLLNPSFGSGSGGAGGWSRTSSAAWSIPNPDPNPRSTSVSPGKAGMGSASASVSGDGDGEGQYENRGSSPHSKSPSKLSASAKSGQSPNMLNTKIGKTGRRSLLGRQAQSPTKLRSSENLSNGESDGSDADEV